jgi:hypothetical protein
LVAVGDSLPPVPSNVKRAVTEELPLAEPGLLPSAFRPRRNEPAGRGLEARIYLTLTQTLASAPFWSIRSYSLRVRRGDVLTARGVGASNEGEPSMRRRLLVLLAALVTCGSFATQASALPPPYDFTGQWSGDLTGKGETVPVGAAFTATTDPRIFTGTLTVGSPLNLNCTLTAKYRRTLKMHLTCDNGKSSTLRAHFNRTTFALTGSVVLGHKHPVRGKYMLTRTPA